MAKDPLETKAGRDTLPANWAAASVVLFREIRSILGVWAPWLLILALFGFGFYKFEELRSTHLKEIKNSLVEMRDTYRSMASVTAQQIENFDRTLEIRDDLDSKLRKLEGQAGDMQDDLDNARNAVTEAERAAEAARAEKRTRSGLKWRRCETLSALMTKLSSARRSSSVM